MKSLQGRIARLESRNAPIDFSSWFRRKSEEVQECALRRLPSDDLVFFSELFSVDEAGKRNEMIRANPQAWSRWEEAFDWAVQHVPAPYAMNVYDRWI